MKHDYDCIDHGSYYTSDCGDFCEFKKEAVAECIESSLHFVSIVSEGGYDRCFNCGAKV